MEVQLKPRKSIIAMFKELIASGKEEADAIAEAEAAGNADAKVVFEGLNERGIGTLPKVKLTDGIRKKVKGTNSGFSSKKSVEQQARKTEEMERGERL